MLKNRSDWIPVAAIAIGTAWGLGVTGVFVEELHEEGLHVEHEMHFHMDHATEHEHDGETVSVDVSVRAGAPAEARRIRIVGGDNPRIRMSPSVDVSKQPLIYVDGERLDRDAFDDLDPALIDRVEVVKGEAALELFGDDATGGVVQVFLKPEGGR